MKIKNEKNIAERVRLLDLDNGELFRCIDDDELCMVMESIECINTSVYNCVCLNDGSVYDLDTMTEVIPITDYEFIVKE